MQLFDFRLSIQEEKFKEQLLKEGLLNQKQFDSLLIKLKQANAQQYRSLLGWMIYLDPSAVLTIVSFPDNEIQVQFPLLDEKGAKPNTCTLGQKKHSLGFFHPKTGELLGKKTLNTRHPQGLIMSQAGKNYLYFKGFENEAFLASSPYLLAVPDAKEHFDLYLLPSQEHLLIFHREEGVLIIFSLSSFDIVDEFSLVEGGSDKALNITADPQALNDKIYITDNISQNLYILTIENDEFTINTWVSGMGPLGNVCFGPDPDYLYICRYQPEFSLLYFNLQTFKAEYSVAVSGKSACYQGPLARDLIQSTTKTLYTVTHENQSKTGQSTVHVINMQEVQVREQHVLAPDTCPDILALAKSTPFKDVQKVSFEDMLISECILDEEQIAALKAPKKAPKPPALKAVKQMVRKAPLKTFKAHQPPHQKKNILELIDKEGEPIQLPAQATEVIVRLLVFAFYQNTLTNLEVHAKEIFKLQRIAAKVRKRLETKLAIMVTVPSILGKYNFETPLDRQTVLSQLDIFEKNPDQKYNLNLCPDCQQPMEEVELCLQCPGCGLAFDTPSERDWRPQVSAESGGALPAGCFVLPLKQNNHVLIMNPWHHILKRLDGKKAWLKEISSVIVLPNQNLLIADAKGNKVAEYNPLGKVTWKALAALKEPSALAYYTREDDEERIIIVEKGNNRVIEMNRKGKQLRKYPTLKTAEEARLKDPSDIQRTPQDHWLIADTGNHRVIEVNPRGDIIKTFSALHGIKSPIFARCIPGAQILIVDQDQYQVYIFDLNQNLKYQSGYWPPEDPSFSAKSPPDTVMRLHNGNLLFAGEGYYLQFDPIKGHYCWLKTVSEAMTTAQSIEKVEVNARARSIDRREIAEQYAAFLKTMDIFSNFSKSQLMSLAEHLKSVHMGPKELLKKDVGLGGALYFVQEGQVKINKDNDTILELGPGSTIGAISVVLSTGEMKANAYTLTDCKLLKLDKTSLQKVMVKFSQIYQLLRTLAFERQGVIRRFQDQESMKATEELTHTIMVKKAMAHPLLSEGNSVFYEALASKMRAVAYLPDQIVFGRGESGGILYLINEGQLGVLRKGERHPNLFLRDGDVFGEMALINNRSRNATLMTQDYCKLYELDVSDFKQLMQNHPWLRHKFEEIVNIREEQNQEDLRFFKEQMGIARPDLPKVDVWSPIQFREDELVYFPTVLMDMVLGVENDGDILWCCGKEDALSFFQPYRIHFKADHFFVADTGNDRIVLIDTETRQQVFEWKNKTQGLSQPRSATRTRDGLMLIADEANSRLVVLNDKDEQVWEYGSPHEIMSPFYAEETDDGTILFADQGLHQVFELNRQNEVLWSYGKTMIGGDGPGELLEPSFAHRLNTGETLICDTGNDRILIVGRDGKENAIYYGTEEFPLLRPKHCEVRENGDIFVFSGAEERVVRLDTWGDPIWSVYLTPSTEVVVTSQQEAESGWDAVFDKPAERPKEVLDDKYRVTQDMRWSDLALENPLKNVTHQKQPERSESEPVNEVDIKLRQTQAKRWSDLGLDNDISASKD